MVFKNEFGSSNWGYFPREKYEKVVLLRHFYMPYLRNVITYGYGYGKTGYYVLTGDH